MTLKIFSIFDSKALAFLPPFFTPTAGVALRNFEVAANEEGHAFHKHASDYGLFELGEFDDATAAITMHKTPISLGVAQSLIQDLTPTAIHEVK